MSPANSMPPVLQASSLSKSFGRKTALHEFNLSLPASGITAILGANGAGKTTFIRCALGLTRASGGTLKVFGGQPGRLDARRRIGAMLQASDLPDLLTPREQITLFSSYYPAPMAQSDVLELCGLSGFADKRYKTLSGGQKRRTQFALAIIGQPDLIFLDEPTTGLDTEARRNLWDAVRALAAAGKSVLLTTHYLEEADALADRIIVMSEGTITAEGSTEEIRNLAGGAIVRCVTDLPLSTLEALAQVRRVRRSGRYVELVTPSAPASLKALLDLDPNPVDLTVMKPSLETAVTDLTGNPNEEG